MVTLLSIPSRLPGPTLTEKLCPFFDSSTLLHRSVSLLSMAPRRACRLSGETFFIIHLDLCTVIPGLVTVVPPVLIVVVSVPRLTRLSIGIMFIICLELALVTSAPNIRRLLKFSPAVVLILQLLLTRLPERVHLHAPNGTFVRLSRIAVGAELVFPLRPPPFTLTYLKMHPRWPVKGSLLRDESFRIKPHPANRVDRLVTAYLETLVKHSRACITP